MNGGQKQPEWILAIAVTRIGGLSSGALTRTRKHVTFDEFFVSGKHHVARAALAAKARLIHPVERDPDLAAFHDIPDVAGLRRFLDTNPAPWHRAATAGGLPSTCCPRPGPARGNVWPRLHPPPRPCAPRLH